MKIISPTMLGASHQVVSSWVAVAEPVLFLTSSVGLQVWAGGGDTQAFSAFPQPPETLGGKAPTPVCGSAPCNPLLSLRPHPAYLVHWPARTR